MRSKPVKTWEKGNYRYNVYHEIDEDPDISYLEQDYKDESPADRKKYLAQDKARLNNLYAGKWHYLTIGVEITVKTSAGWASATLVGRDYLSGIESDSGDGYIKTVEDDLVSGAEDDIDKLREALFDDIAALRHTAQLIPCDCPSRRHSIADPKAKGGLIKACNGTCAHSKIIAQATALELLKTKTEKEVA